MSFPFCCKDINAITCNMSRQCQNFINQFTFLLRKFELQDNLFFNIALLQITQKNVDNNYLKNCQAWAQLSCPIFKPSKFRDEPFSNIPTTTTSSSPNSAQMNPYLSLYNNFIDEFTFQILPPPTTQHKPQTYFILDQIRFNKLSSLSRFSFGAFRQKFQLSLLDVIEVKAYLYN